MDNVDSERRSRKYQHKRARSASPSSDNLDRSVSRSSSHRQKSKRSRRQSPKRMRSNERRDSKRKSKKRELSKRRSRITRTRNVSEQNTSTFTMQLRPKTNAPAPSTSTCAAIPSTSSARPTVALVQVNASTAVTQKTPSNCNTVARIVPGGKLVASRSKNHSTDGSITSGQSGSSQSVNTNSKSHAHQTKSRAPSVEECSESELQCSICSELFIKATMLNCIHTFCKYCIDMWKRNKAECPLCRTPITSECRITKFDVMIEAMSGKTEESKKQRMDVLKEREECEVNLSNQETHSSAQGRPALRLSDFATAIRLILGDRNSEEETEETVDINDNDNYYDSSPLSEMLIIDIDSEDGTTAYGYLTDSEENGDDDFVGVEYSDANTDNDGNNEDEGSDVYAIEEDCNSDANGALTGTESVDNDNVSINSDENVASESSDENDNRGGDSEGDATSEGVIYSGDSDDNTDHEADENNEDDSENEENNSSHDTDGNLDDDGHNYNENDEGDYYEEENNDNSVDDHEYASDIDARGYASDDNIIDACEYASDNNSIDAREYVSDNNSNDIYENDEYDSDVSYDDGDYN